MPGDLGLSTATTRFTVRSGQARSTVRSGPAGRANARLEARSKELRDVGDRPRKIGGIVDAALV